MKAVTKRKRQEHKVRSCEGKKPLTPEEAYTAVKRMNTDRHPADKVHFYRCDCCGSCHVGHLFNSTDRARMKLLGTLDGTITTGPMWHLKKGKA